MRWFCHIFCAYLLALTCLPCSDGDHEHAQAALGTVTTLQAAGTHDEHSHCSDLCSPLCQCSCCGSILLNTQTAALIPADPALIAEHTGFHYRSPYSTGQPDLLLRPPIC